MPGLYSEARDWFGWLGMFTPGMLADAMGVDDTVADRMVLAGEFHGIIYDTGDRVNGTWRGEQPLFGYVPLPPGPTEHPTETPPERLAGYTDIVCPRGEPVRIRTDRDTRRLMSTPGARSKVLQREKRYEKMMETQRQRAERAKIRAAQGLVDPKWKKKKKKSGVVASG